MRIIGDGSRRQPQGLYVFDPHQTIDGSGHVFVVHEGVASGNHDLFDGRRIFHVLDGPIHIGRSWVRLVARLLVFAKTEPAIDRTAHVEQEDDPVLVHLFQQTLMELADPGIGVSGRIQLLYERHVLVCHICRHPHMPDGVHAQPDRVRVKNLLACRFGPIRQASCWFPFPAGRWSGWRRSGYRAESPP